MSLTNHQSSMKKRVTWVWSCNESGGISLLVNLESESLFRVPKHLICIGYGLNCGFGIYETNVVGSLKNTVAGQEEWKVE